jgi:uroporphyrinogen-III synthase
MSVPVSPAKSASDDFGGARVLSFESRRHAEIEQLIAKRGGVPLVVASVREVPTGARPDIQQFVRELAAGRLDIVIFTTGVGTKALFDAAQELGPLEPVLAGLRKAVVIARSGKPGGVLRQFDVPVAFTAPEPNTWREVAQLLDANAERIPLAGKRVAIQEHGAPSEELCAFLRERGAEVLPVHPYRWELPEDVAPLRDAVAQLVARQIDVVLFTASVQLQHLLQVADQMGQRAAVLAALRRAVIASIGPVTSAQLAKAGLSVDVEPAHPKMGFLVQEAAARAAALLRQKAQAQA